MLYLITKATQESTAVLETNSNEDYKLSFCIVWH